MALIRSREFDKQRVLPSLPNAKQSVASICLEIFLKNRSELVAALIQLKKKENTF